MLRLSGSIFSLALIGGLLLGTSEVWADNATHLKAAPKSSAETAMLDDPSIPAIDPSFPQAFTPRTLGQENAPVKMTVYSALTCNHCGDFFLEVLPKLKTTYVDTGKVHMTFKEFPFNLPGLHAAMAALCLEPDAFFGFVDAVFRTQPSWLGQKNPEQHLKQLAGFSGLSPEKYVACTTSKPLEAHMIRERIHATNDLEISATPTFLFEGTLERIVGTQSYGTYASMIERQLERTKERSENASPAATSQDASQSIEKSEE